MRSTVLDILPYLTAIISYMQHLQIELVLSSVEMFSSLAGNYEKHAPRISQVIAAVAKVSCKHGLWLVARVNAKIHIFTVVKMMWMEYNSNRLRKKKNLKCARTLIF